MATICGQLWDEARRQWVFTTCFADDRKFHRDEIRKELRAKYPGKQTRLLVSDDDHVGAGVVCDCDGSNCECKGVEKAKDPREVLNNLTDALSDYLEVTHPHAAQGAGDLDDLDLDDDDEATAKPQRGRRGTSDATEPGENPSDRTPQEDEGVVRERYRRGLAAALFRQRALGDGSMSARLAERQLSAALRQVPPRRKGMIARMTAGDLSGL